MRSRLLTVSLLLSAVAQAEVNQHITDARRHLDEVDYPAAAASLVSAREELGNDRATSVEVRLLQGVIAAQMKQPDAARDFFVEALTIDPEKRLVGSYSPRVKAPFAEALNLVATQGPLAISADAPAIADGRVQALKVRVDHDPLKLLLAVRFHFRVAAGWEVKQVRVGPTVSVPVDGKHFDWWAEALGEADSVLAQVGSPARLLAAGEADDGVIATLARSPALKLTPTRTTALVLGGVALASTAVGIVFGVRAQSERAQFLSAPLDAVGLVSTITQRQAFALDALARKDSMIANAFFIGAGALAVAGALLWWLWGEPPPVVSAPGQPALTLRFP